MKFLFLKRNVFLRLLLIFSFLGSFLFSSAQMLETKYKLSLSAGTGTLHGNESNIFFPDFVTQKIENYNLVCTRKVLTWMDAGLSIGYLKLNSIDLSEGPIKNMTSYQGNIKGGGPVFSFHLPYVRSGIWNRLIPLIRVSSSMQFLESERVIEFDNVIFYEGAEEISPTVRMPEADMGVGFSINPGIKYRASQFFGLYLGLAYSYFSFNTKYGSEQLKPLFFEVGLSLNFGNYKTLYL
ncbi:hypothetical protein [Marinilabilia sp.]|uniref:hypothetical protein n=1 Tax=Marinilabilia sp. TaxID=2021252 RepID=UPI0025BC3F46|nr:hypothetical protein [Marinilabilia sp.]